MCIIYVVKLVIFLSNHTTLPHPLLTSHHTPTPSTYITPHSHTLYLHHTTIPHRAHSHYTPTPNRHTTLPLPHSPHSHTLHTHHTTPPTPHSHTQLVGAASNNAIPTRVQQTSRLHWVN